MKPCTKCSRPQPLKNFHRDKNRPGGRYPQCRTCVREKCRRRYQRRGREYELQRKYGIGESDIMARIRLYEGNCSLCFKPLARERHTDHDHKTGRVRGILHPACNLLLGHAKDNPALLRLAAEYLEPKIDYDLGPKARPFSLKPRADR